MKSDMAIGPHLDRRRWLKLAFALLAISVLSNSVLNAQSERQSCVPEIPQHHEPSNGDTVHSRFLGSTRMAITTSRPCRTSNFPAFTTSNEGWAAAAASMEWERTIRGTGWQGGPGRPIQLHGRRVFWQRDRPMTVFLLTLDSPCLRGREPRQSDSWLPLANFR
jgi:hypothetical protein